MPGRADLFRIFSPTQELLDPERFAGRSDEVLRLTDALMEAKSCLLIYGHRGLGKSSLAVQMDRIAQGDVALLGDLGQADRALVGEQRFLVLWITCTDAVSNFHDLLQIMINTAEQIESQERESAGGDKHPTLVLVDRTTRRGLSYRGFGVDTTRTYREAVKVPGHTSLNTEERFDATCQLLVNTFQQPVLFIVDELDRMRSRSGLASFVKAQSGENLKFLFVGIATSVAELLADHASLERSLRAVEVPLMRPMDLIEIVTRAEGVLKESGFAFVFSRAAKLAIANISAGFPWFVHAIGQLALVQAYDAGIVVIDDSQVQHAAESMMRQDFASHFENTYLSVARGALKRETFLRICAEWPTPDIPVSDTYAAARRLGVSSPSRHKGSLLSADFGDVLVEVPAQHGMVRFSNQMFKAYVRMRPSLADGLADTVRAAFGR